MPEIEGKKEHQHGTHFTIELQHDIKNITCILLRYFLKCHCCIILVRNNTVSEFISIKTNACVAGRGWVEAIHMEHNKRKKKKKDGDQFLHICLFSNLFMKKQNVSLRYAIRGQSTKSKC